MTRGIPIELRSLIGAKLFGFIYIKHIKQNLKHFSNCNLHPINIDLVLHHQHSEEGDKIMKGKLVDKMKILDEYGIICSRDALNYVLRGASY